MTHSRGAGMSGVCWLDGPLCGFDTDSGSDRVGTAIQLHCPELRHLRLNGAKD